MNERTAVSVAFCVALARSRDLEVGAAEHRDNGPGPVRGGSEPLRYMPFLTGDRLAKDFYGKDSTCLANDSLIRHTAVRPIIS